MNLDKQRVGDYVLTEQLRQDETGTFYRGVHAGSARQAMVKVLHERYGRDPALVARFHREVETLRRIGHPGVVAVLDHGASAEGLYLVTESLSGASLAERLKRDGRLSLAETQRIVAALAGALAAAHRMRVVHRDLRADDVFLLENGEIKLLNLGLAKIVAGPGPGSPREVDQRADIQALGRLAYEMLCGCAPAPGEGVGSGNQRPRTAPLSTHGVAVPSAVEAAIMKALERKKKRRFSSMAEFARAFGVGMPSAPVAPPPAPVRVSPPPLPSRSSPPPLPPRPPVAPAADGSTP